MMYFVRVTAPAVEGCEVLVGPYRTRDAADTSIVKSMLLPESPFYPAYVLGAEVPPTFAAIWNVVRSPSPGMRLDDPIYFSFASLREAMAKANRQGENKCSTSK